MDIRPVTSTDLAQLRARWPIPGDNARSAYRAAVEIDYLHVRPE